MAWLVFTAGMHVMQRTVLPRPFSPSVRLSVCQKRGLWQNERNLHPRSYTKWKTINPSFLTKRMVGGETAATSCTLNFVPILPCWSENADFQSIFARIAPQP